MVTLQPTLQMRCTKALGKAWGEGFSCWVEVRLVQRDQEGQGHEAWQRAGGGPHTVAMP